MVFYTLQGPGHKLEIYEDKIRLVKKAWYGLITFGPQEQNWEIQKLSHIQISNSQYLLPGKLEWQSFDGVSGSFRFTTSNLMVKKIETYLQKRIVKNHQKSLEKQAPAKKEVAPEPTLTQETVVEMKPKRKKSKKEGRNAA